MNDKREEVTLGSQKGTPSSWRFSRGVTGVCQGAVHVPRQHGETEQRERYSIRHQRRHVVFAGGVQEEQNLNFPC